jgi:hypothetical protein
VGQGTFVNESRAARAAARPVAVPARLDWGALLSRSARIISADEERLRAFGTGNGTHSTIISFAGGMPDSALFPTDAFRRVLNQVIREEGESLLQYSSVGGYAPLRRYLAGYLLRFGVEARAEEILIVNGSQQASISSRARCSTRATWSPSSSRPTRGPCRRSARSARACCPSSGTRPGRARTCSSGSASGRRRRCSTASRAATTRADSPWTRKSGASCWRRPRATRCPSSRTASTAASTTAPGPARR